VVSSQLRISVLALSKVAWPELLRRYRHGEELQEGPDLAKLRPRYLKLSLQCLTHLSWRTAACFFVSQETPMTLTRRTALLAPILTSPLLAAPLRDVAAQDYPVGTIRIIAPGPAGSPRDLRARWAAEQLGPALDRPVVVDNKPGAGGNIGMEAAARSAPDGRTLVIVDNGTLTQNPHIYQRPGYARADFAPVIVLIENSLLLAVPAASPVRKVSDLLALAQATPGKLSYGSPGIGTPPHLAGELFSRAAGIDVVHVPYKGATPAIQDLVGGRLDYVIDSIALLQPLAAAGKVHAIAVSGPARLEGLPDIPTFAESGLPGVIYVAWMGLAVTAGTPAPLIERLNRELVRALATDQAKAWFRSQGASVLGGTPADFAKRIEADYQRWGDIIPERVNDFAPPVVMNLVSNSPVSGARIFHPAAG
jgi:tripartite-type tricarboxylate transporter receptor subunit TctC